MPHNFLIAGERRLEAMKLLGYEETEVRIMTIKDAEHQLNLEISENETRKDFSKAERIEYARRLEKIESLKARERMLSGKSPNPKQNFAEGNKGQARDTVASKLGIGSGFQYEKEKYICDNKDSLTPEDFSKAERIEYARRLEKIESLKAHQRKLHTQNNNTSRADRETFPTLVAQGRAREVVSEKLGIGSGRSLKARDRMLLEKTSDPSEIFRTPKIGRVMDAVAEKLNIGSLPNV